MEARDLARWRLATQGVTQSRCATSEAAIKALTASQAQDLLPGRWSLAQRCTPTATDDEVATALDAGRIVRTHVLRPTWHVVHPPDLLWLLSATSPRVHRLNASMYRSLGVDAQLMSRVRPILEQSLSGRSLTRADLGSALAQSGIDAPPMRATYIAMYAELEGWICNGRRQGKQQTYALVSERIQDATQTGSRDEALALLAGRYFTSRGPATVKDFAAWASLTLTEARAAAAASAADLGEVEAEGRCYLVAAGSAPPEAGAGPPHVMFAQAYDELVMSYTDSRDVLTCGGELWDLPSRNFMHPVLIDGQLGGHWRYERNGAGRPATVRTRLIRDLTAEEREAMEGEVGRFAGFVGGEVTWQ